MCYIYKLTYSIIFCTCDVTLDKYHMQNSKWQNQESNLNQEIRRIIGLFERNKEKEGETWVSF